MNNGKYPVGKPPKTKQKRRKVRNFFISQYVDPTEAKGMG
jgi:hypothetical protein